MDQSDPSQLGMMSSAGQSPENPAPTSGRQPYNGIIEINGEKVAVKNGVLDYDGDRAFVSDDGSMVIMPDRTVIGYIREGKFEETSPEHLGELRAKGVME